MTPDHEWYDFGTFTPHVSAQITKMFHLEGPQMTPTPATPAVTPAVPASTVSDKMLVALQYAPYVLAAVQVIEATSAGLPGATKKAVVLSSVQAVAKVGATVPDSHVQIISVLVDLICGLLFKPKPATAVQT